MCKVSVIIPTFNAELTIRRAVESILEQTFQDFEIIIYDDVSSDETWEMLVMLSKLDARIKVFRNEVNSKSAYTRNAAIRVSKGDYIMQLDDDDYCSLDRMKKQVEFLEQNPNFDFVGSNGYLWNHDGIYAEIRVPENPQNKDLLSTSPFINPSVMFRKTALEKVGMYRVSSETIRGQDYDLFLRMYCKGLKGYNIQENLIYYYKDQNYFGKINWKSRLGEVKFRYRNFKKLKLFPLAYPYVLKPLIALLIPNRILFWNQRRVLHDIKL